MPTATTGIVIKGICWTALRGGIIISTVQAEDDFPAFWAFNAGKEHL